MDSKAFARSAAIVAKWAKLKATPTNAAYRTDLAKAADAILTKQGLDIYGKSYKPAVVHVTPGGK
jgi:NitT/TauT family transport system substrate-binding protein